jgi:hypothetical protein
MKKEKKKEKKLKKKETHGATIQRRYDEFTELRRHHGEEFILL